MTATNVVFVGIGELESISVGNNLHLRFWSAKFKVCYREYIIIIILKMDHLAYNSYR